MSLVRATRDPPTDLRRSWGESKATAKSFAPFRLTWAFKDVADKKKCFRFRERNLEPGNSAEVRILILVLWVKDTWPTIPRSVLHISHIPRHCASESTRNNWINDIWNSPPAQGVFSWWVRGDRREVPSHEVIYSRIRFGYSGKHSVASLSTWAHSSKHCRARHLLDMIVFI